LGQGKKRVIARGHVREGHRRSSSAPTVRLQRPQYSARPVFRLRSIIWRQCQGLDAVPAQIGSPRHEREAYFFFHTFTRESGNFFDI
jgi:hypothetical protein